MPKTRDPDRIAYSVAELTQVFNNREVMGCMCRKAQLLLKRLGCCSEDINDHINTAMLRVLQKRRTIPKPKDDKRNEEAHITYFFCLICTAITRQSWEKCRRRQELFEHWQLDIPKERDVMNFSTNSMLGLEGIFDDRERKIVQALINGCHADEIANLLNISPSNYYKLRLQIIKKIKSHCEFE